MQRGIATQLPQSSTLNLTSKKSDKTRQISTELVTDGFQTLLKDIELLKKHYSKYSKMMKAKIAGEEVTLLQLSHQEFKYHPVEDEDPSIALGAGFWDSPYLMKILQKLSDLKPQTYDETIGTLKQTVIKTKISTSVKDRVLERLSQKS